jgi:hypothetical protein
VITGRVSSDADNSCSNHETTGLEALSSLHHRVPAHRTRIKSLELAADVGGLGGEQLAQPLVVGRRPADVLPLTAEQILESGLVANRVEVCSFRSASSAAA